jgi:predicted ATPase
MERGASVQTVHDILSRSGVINTCWCVISGAPSSGKTTVVEVLRARGMSTNPDITRAYIDEERAKGRTKEEVKADQEQFRRITFERMVMQAATLEPTEFMVHDGGIPDCIAYRRLVGVEVGADVHRACQIFRYRSVLLFDPLQYQEDNVRTEDADFQRRLSPLLEDTYRELGYSVARIPQASLGARVRGVLTALE